MATELIALAQSRFRTRNASILDSVGRAPVIWMTTPIIANGAVGFGP